MASVTFRCKRGIVANVVLALTLASCASLHATLTNMTNVDPLSLSPPQRAGYETAQSFVDQTARLYEISKMSVRVRPLRLGRAAIYEDGQLVLDPSYLTRVTDVVLAHEMGHALLGHTIPFWNPKSVIPELPRYEMEANAKAVEILVRVRGLDEREAFKSVYAALYAVHRAQIAGTLFSYGWHAPACLEIADLVQRFPAHRDWASRLDCADGKTTLKPSRR